MDIDTIIVGSGFGGAVHACRLAEAGQSVVVLERGRRWTVDSFPRGLDDDWVFDIDEPEKQNGWLDLRFLDDMWVAMGAGVGGGSLIYANVSINASPAVFNTGWPRAISFGTLEPFYRRVSEMLQPAVLPDNQLTPRFELMRDAAKALGVQSRFRKVELAVSFDPEGRYPGKAPDDETATRRFINAQGREQGYCIHAGNCDIGCKAQARNTLDLNYLAVAEDRGADIRPLCLVSHVIPEANGYRVIFHQLQNGRKTEHSLSARQVVLAAGSLGSTEILFRSRDQFATLPDISQALGRYWSSNGDFVTPAFYSDRTLSPTLGPTISSAIDYLDGSAHQSRFFIEDGGFPNVLGNFLRARTRRSGRFSASRKLLRLIATALDDGDPLENMMPWFGQAMDAGDGRLYLGRDWLRPWKRRLKLNWDVGRSERALDGLIKAQLQLSAATGGRAWVPPSWTVLRNLVTPHPLGGCSMAASRGRGVVDDQGRVYGYPGLYVSDGSVFPAPIGLNPSKTIAALAERSAQLMLN